MGYRSEVFIAVRKADFTALLSQINDDKELATTKYVVEAAEVDETTLDDEPWSIVKWFDIKWYSDYYPEIIYLENWMRSLPTYHFVCVGEEPGDITEEYKGENPGFFEPYSSIKTYY